MNKSLKVFLWVVGVGLVAYVGYKIYMANKAPKPVSPGLTTGSMTTVDNLSQGN